MKLIISPRAEKQLRKLSKIDQIAVARKIKLLAGGQRQKTESLSGYKNIYRIRVGDLRIVYKKTRKLIYIILIHRREEVYRVLKRLLG